MHQQPLVVFNLQVSKKFMHKSKEHRKVQLNIVAMEHAQFQPTHNSHPNQVPSDQFHSINSISTNSHPIANVYCSCVCSTLLYGSETWTSTSVQEKKHNTFNLLSLRRILKLHGNKRSPTRKCLDLLF